MAAKRLIIAYPTLGKTTLTKADNRFVDVDYHFVSKMFGKIARDNCVEATRLTEMTIINCLNAGYHVLTNTLTLSEGFLTNLFLTDVSVSVVLPDYGKEELRRRLLNRGSFDEVIEYLVNNHAKAIDDWNNFAQRNELYYYYAFNMTEWADEHIND